MALRPSDLNDGIENKVKEAEKFIDDYLKKNYDGTSISISLEGLHLSAQVERKIIRLYTQASWKVKIYSDRNESYITLTPE